MRWESRNGRHGYMPAAERDWKTYLASAPEKRRKVDRQTRKLLPLTDEVIRKHLAGEITVGIYPLLSDETCWFLAVDFDKKTWQLDAAAFLATCHEMGVPATLERSRSGLLIPMKAVSDSDLIPVTRSDAMPVMIGAQRRGLLLLTALFAHRSPPPHLEAVGVMHQAVQNAIGPSRILNWLQI